MSTVENSKLTNVNGGLARVTVIAADLGADGKSFTGYEIHSSIIGAPDSGISYPINTILPQNNEMNDIYSRGNFIGATLGSETLQEMTVSMSFINDFVYKMTGQVGAEYMNNILVNMLKAEAYKVGGKIYKVYGTNGVKKTAKTASVVTGLKNLFLKDGEMILPQAFSETTGKPLTTANTRIPAYNNKSLCVMLEHLTAFDDTNKQGIRFVYTLASNFMLAENDDINKITFDAMFLSEAKHIESFWIDGFGANEADNLAITGAGSVFKINANYIVKNTTPAAPSFAGTAGDVCAVVDTDNGNVYVYKYSTTWSADPVTSTLGVGCTITAPLTGTTLATTPATSGRAYLIINTAGVSGSAVALAEKATTPTYVWTVKDFDFATQTMVAY
jgi:hypothetical protein